MNIAITNGLQLMPPDFRAGLRVWSRTDGTSGSPRWSDAPNAGIVPGDQDFGVCMEISKTDTITRLRFVGETPMIPGVYLRVSARLKAIAGPLCSARIAGWAGTASRTHVGGLVEVGPAVAMRSYGDIIEVSAIVGVGARPGVDMRWGTVPVFGHFGLDLVGANGGSIRIESVRIEDITAAFVPSMIDWVDVRDYGAIGNGTTDDRAAFIAADRAAKGGGILVPEGRYRIGSDLSINAPIRFKGTLTAPAAVRIAFMQSFDFPTYADAFGNETLGLEKALQAMFGYVDHVELDLRGRRVDLARPIQIHNLVKGRSWSSRRSIANGQILALNTAAFRTGTATSTAKYDINSPYQLTNVANVAAIEVGSRVIGNGVGREVYVRARNVAAKSLTLSQPLYGGSATRTYAFHRYRYLFDFSGCTNFDRLQFVDLELHCNGVASGIMLPPSGSMFSIRDCYVTRPRDRGITSIGRGCQDLLVDRCQFISNESEKNAQDRTSIAINVNANDTKIRDNRFVRFGHFMVANGGGHIISGNHWFQGDGRKDGLRYAGLVLTLTNVQTTITGNYVDNSSIEWTNEHSARPRFTGSQYSFGGLTITGNTFLCSNTVNWFTWLTVKPYGPGHFIHGLTVSGNVFKALDGAVQRIERVDTSFADLDYNSMRNIQFDGNTFNGIETYVANPLLVRHQQAAAAVTWTPAVVRGLPFMGWVRSIGSVVAETPITNAAGARVAEMPWTQTMIGASHRQLRLNWKSAVKGTVAMQVRMDMPG
ncbi:right-handed parallel beta-helix repeat-containing protein [Paracoccus sp. TK19116]|uniref:Right-handed parallel beta-helix repeat-containing protein n=1 Tax=Paracoccus albicereus TaxID=2922394 RepID=A0ABT1MU19_9RHOB|nr:glycosyl hydrolase family 28-related protein [Paracoccus albicereus]MCQ0971834.1 right-handed parallel beta-helix repeat-containing protein [Paracoccus albicereus]